MSRHPIPDAALDDRLAIVGISGSGKTNAAATGVERLLEIRARVAIVDPLDVWYGLRLKRDGVKPAFPVVIFGGARGDLPIAEHAGGLIGETVAAMAESCIVSLAGLGSKAAERRFMLAFLEALYRKAAGEPLHLVFDEADLWAPQKSSEPQLQNLMENIVRRGRVKGFIPWLITQRPAVLSKDVLSQADGLIAMKLTSSQDRDAIGGWIEGQADRADQKQMLARLPQLERGAGVVWIPGRDILQEVRFPLKDTFDSSRTPKRGETVRAAALKPIDLGSLKDRLLRIEVETAANDPKKLKAQIADLTKQLATGARAKGATGLTRGPEKRAALDPEQVKALEQRGYAKARAETARGVAAVKRIMQQVNDKIVDVEAKLETAIGGLGTLENVHAHPATATPRLNGPVRPAAAKPSPLPAVEHAALATDESGFKPSYPQQRILDALAFMESIGASPVDKSQLALLAEASPSSSSYTNNLGGLRTAQLIDYPRGGVVALLEAGRLWARAPDSPPDLHALHATIKGRLSGPQGRILETAIAAYPDTLDKAELADAVEASPNSSSYTNNLGRLRSLGLIDYVAGRVTATKVLFPEGLQ